MICSTRCYIQTFKDPSLERVSLSVIGIFSKFVFQRLNQKDFVFQSLLSQVYIWKSLLRTFDTINALTQVKDSLSQFVGITMDSRSVFKNVSDDKKRPSVSTTEERSNTYQTLEYQEDAQVPDQFAVETPAALVTGRILRSCLNGSAPRKIRASPAQAPRKHQ